MWFWLVCFSYLFSGHHENSTTSCCKIWHGCFLIQQSLIFFVQLKGGCIALKWIKSPACLVQQQSQMQLISSVLNRIPAVNGNYSEELQGTGIIGSLKKREERKRQIRSYILVRFCCFLFVTILEFPKLILLRAARVKRNLRVFFTSSRSNYQFLNKR